MGDMGLRQGRARLVAVAAMARHTHERERRERLEHGSELAGSGGFGSEDKHGRRKRR